MPPTLFLLLLLETVYASLPLIDSQVKSPTLTVSPTVNVSTMFSANPLLRKLSMFADGEVVARPRQRAATTPRSTDRKRSPGDNFFALYKKLNESLSKMSDRQQGRIEQTANSIDDPYGSEEAGDDEPFAVTETLLDSLKPQVAVPSWEDNPWTGQQQSPATRTFSPIPESTPPPPVVETFDEVEEVPRPALQELHSGDAQSRHNKKGLLAPLRRASDWQVHPSGNGRFLVSGTQLYQDNRIDGGVVSENHPLPGNDLEVEEIKHDKRFAIEAELTSMRAHAAALKKLDRPVTRGAKTLALGNPVAIEERRRTVRYLDGPYPSKAQIIERNGRKIELRKIDRRGQEVQVELLNPLLWNHDYISSPGAIIHDSFKSAPKRFKLAAVSKCFELIENTRLAGVLPLDRRIGNSALDCLRMCARSPACHTIVYEETLSMCEIFSEKPGDGGSSLQQSTSSILFEPIVEDIEKCLAAARTKAHAARTVDGNTRSHCPRGEEFVLTRQEGMRAVHGQYRDKFTTNEDDCVSACLSGSRKCLSAGYSHETQECALYTKVTAAIEVHEPTTLYSKMCVTEKTASKCAGSIIDHVKQAILLSSMREAKTVRHATDCLDACIRAPFNCLSIMFYPREKTNCILNDGSLFTAPDSFVEEVEREVEYFGMEECYGIQDVTHQRYPKANQKKNYLVEDDIRPGQVTRGSQLEMGRRRRR